MNATQCALRLARLDIDARDAPAINQLIDEADGFLFGMRPDSEVATFYHELAQLVTQSDWGEQKEYLNERALLGLAANLRVRVAGGARPADVIKRLVGADSPWAPEVLRDAELAVRTEAARSRGNNPFPHDALAVPNSRSSPITEVCVAPGGRRIFIRYENGVLLSHDLARALTHTLAEGVGDVGGLAWSSRPETIAVLRQIPRVELAFYDPDLDRQTTPRQLARICHNTHAYLARSLDDNRVHGVCTPEGVWLVDSRSGNSQGCVEMPPGWRPDHPTFLFTDKIRGLGQTCSILTIAEDSWVICTASNQNPSTTLVLCDANWTARRPGHAYATTVATYSYLPGNLNLAAICADGTLANFRISLQSLRVSKRVTSPQGEYLALAFLRQDMLAAATRERVDVFHERTETWARTSTRRHPCGNVVGCGSLDSQGIVVVGRNGAAQRVGL